MPWIDKEICTGCQICLPKCPVFTIRVTDNKAEIDMEGCIRCGVCHEVCVLEAVKHDSEKEDEWVEEKIRLAIRNRDLCEKLLGGSQYGKESLERTIKSYKREKRILQRAVESLEELYNKL